VEHVSTNVLTSGSDPSTEDELPNEELQRSLKVAEQLAIAESLGLPRNETEAQTPRLFAANAVIRQTIELCHEFEEESDQRRFLRQFRTGLLECKNQL
jgi:hypothetical protein